MSSSGVYEAEAVGDHQKTLNFVNSNIIFL